MALAVDACFVGGTVGVDLALRPAVGRGALHLRQAGALAPLPNGPGRGAVGTAGVRVAGIHSLNRFNGWRWSPAGNKRISNVALVADADWEMVGDLAVGVGSTQTWAGVHTVQVPTLLV